MTRHVFRRAIMALAVFLMAGAALPLTAQTEAIVHYHRPAADYSGWGLHLWGNGLAAGEVTTWNAPKAFEGDDAFGKVMSIDLTDASQVLNFIVHKGNDKDTPNDRAFTPATNAEVWLIQGDETIYTSNPHAHATATVHYYRPGGDYTGWGLHLWGSAIDPAEVTAWSTPKSFTGNDAFGKYATIDLVNSALPIDFIVHKGNDKDTPSDRAFTPNQSPEIWLIQGDATVYTSNPNGGPPSGYARIHYRRGDSNYTGWGLHLWGDGLGAGEATTWPSVKAFSASDSYGNYADVAISDGSKTVNLMVHNNGNQDVGATSFVPNTDGFEVWLAQGSSSVYTSEAAGLLASQKVYEAAARWVTADTIAWIMSNASAYQYTLYADPDGEVYVDGDTVTMGAQGVSYSLSYGGDFQSMDPASEFYTRFAYLKNHGFSKISVPAMTAQQLDTALQGQLVIVARSGSTVVGATALQRAGVLDENYAYAGDDLGVTFSGGAPTLKLWAPTAKSVKVHIYPDGTSASIQTQTMTATGDGVWAATGPASWKNKYYLYEVEVFSRTRGEVAHNFATDPYSLSLSGNSGRSQIVDMNDAALKPSGWDSHVVQEHYPFDAPEDMTIYELHVRDFSIFDASVPVSQQGTFKAFTQTASTGMQHLIGLAQSGLTHIHLLPVNDMKSVNEDTGTRIDLTDNIEELYPGHIQTGSTILSVLESMDSDSDQQQAVMTDLRGRDGFNWGYDPYHFMVPEGSYATNPDGATRILEFREMVQALHAQGLRVIPDVVFNHTYDPEIFENVVPDYYYRLNHQGNIENSSCCPDTASENLMFRKLIADALVKWAVHYKVDAFRFDLMGHLTRSAMVAVRSALDQLTLASDGVDGSDIYLYGEGWDFGSLRWLLPDESAYQFGVGGMGIGTFNDRFRDSVKGKGQNPSELFVDDAFITDKTANRDQVLGAMRGTLWDYWGYTSDPQESINYLTAHDKATLWDHLLAKVGSYASLDQMTQMQNLGTGLVALSQGIPFFHAGIEVLRSKSGDENSYNSGDWFNRLDYNYLSNNWGKGLPPGWQSENLEAWDDWSPLLASTPPAGNSHITAALDHFQEMLEIRKSSPLFRLRTMGEIQSRVSFPASIWNDATNAFDGRLVVMKITDFSGTDLDGNYEVVWVLVNTAWSTWLNFYDEDVKRSGFQLHPILQNTTNPYLKSWLDGCCLGAARVTAFSDHSQGGGKISVPPQSILVYVAP